MLRRWRGPIVQTGVQTGDGRIIASGALTWEVPLPLAWMVGGTQHIDMASEAPVIGVIDTIETEDANGVIMAGGYIDDEIPEGAEMIRMLETGSASHGDRMGISVDMDDMAIEIIEQLEEADGEDVEATVLASVEGILTRAGRLLVPAGMVAAAGEPMPDDGVVVWEDAQDDVLMNVTRARLRGATLVATPAFADMFIELDGDAADAPDDADGEDADDEPLTAANLPAFISQFAGGANPFHAPSLAASAPNVPPSEWFNDPNLDTPTPLTIEDGRVWGHVAAWGVCHTGYDRCVTPPRGSDYSTFMSSGRVLTDGGYVDTGAFVWGIRHATLDLRLLEAFAHYEIAEHGFCDVRVGEDDHGIWFAGALRPHVTDDDVRTLRALSISGDWRRRSGRMDMIAGLAVNFPGFPIPRDTEGSLAASSAAVRYDIDGGALALVAAGIVPNAAALPEGACACQAARTSMDAKLDTLLARTQHLIPDAMSAAAGRVPARR